MIATATTLPKAFAVRFSEIARWDPVSFHRIGWQWDEEMMQPIGGVLTQRREKVDRGKFAFADLQPMTIHFDGSVDKRNVDGNREYSMELFFARPGDVVVAKIDLKNGAVAIVPDDWKNVVVTSHFAVYEPDRTKLIPEYLQRLIQTGFFKAHLWRNKVGAEGRKEVKLDFFESEPIPLPSLRDQRKIVSAWDAARKATAATQAKIGRLERDIEAGFLADLGLKAPEHATLPKALAVWWHDFLRWSVTYNQLSQSGMDITQGRNPVVALESCLDLVQYGTSEKANGAGRGTPILRINNVKDRCVDTSDLKHIELPDKVRRTLVLSDGDILVIRTSGSRDLVGTCAAFHEVGDYVFASYLIRLRPDPDKADADFIVWFLNSPLGRQQVDATSRQIMQNNINSEELRSLQVPLPPLHVQKAMMKRVASGRAQIAKLRAESASRAEAAKADVEAMILGAKPVE